MLHIISFTENGMKIGNNICNYFNEKNIKKTNTKKNNIQEDDVVGDSTDRILDCEHMSTCEMEDDSEEIKESAQYVQRLDSTLSEWTKKRFHPGEQILFIGACGIAVRSIAPFIQSKDTDPAVLVMDDHARYVVPILSGHLGGANETAQFIGKITGAIPVITTATDVNNRFAVDLFAKRNHLYIGELQKFKYISSAILKGKCVNMILDEMVDFADSEIDIPKEIKVIKMSHKAVTFDELRSQAAICISNKKAPYSYFGSIGTGSLQKSDIDAADMILQLYPKNLILGVGCKSGKTMVELEDFVRDKLEEQHLAIESVYCIASIDKKADEAGIIALCRKYNWQFVTFPAELLRKQQGSFSRSEFVLQTVGVDNVCERSLSAAGAERLLLKKTCRNGITLAIGEITRRIHFDEQNNRYNNG